MTANAFACSTPTTIPLFGTKLVQPLIIFGLWCFISRRRCRGKIGETDSQKRDNGDEERDHVPLRFALSDCIRFDTGQVRLLQHRQSTEHCRLLVAPAPHG